MSKHLYLTILLFLTLLTTAHPAGFIVTYWGQESTTDSLATTCDTGYYAAIILSYLAIFGYGQTPYLNLHTCNNNCTSLKADIKYCQSKEIAILLAIGGNGNGTYGLNSTEEANSFASYLWDNYLAGKPSTGEPRPLGEDIILDGIHFDIQKGTDMYWSELGNKLLDYSFKASFDVLITAATKCAYPSPYLAKPMADGLFLVTGVQFYDDPTCDYSGGLENLTKSWNLWTSSVMTTQFFMQLPASTEAAKSGYIKPDILVKDVVPLLNSSGLYGGIALWDAYYDKMNNYSQSIYGLV